MISTQPSDMLDADKFNVLPHPLYGRLWGTWWPIESIEVACGLIRFDIIGKLQVDTFSSISSLRDSHGVEHDPDDFYNEETL